jgi:hypothetical protein
MIAIRIARLHLIAATFAVLMATALTTDAREWKVYESEKYGYSLKIPAEFELQAEDKSTSWIFQPGSAPVAGETTKKKKKSLNIGARIKGIDIGTSTSEETATEGTGSGGGLESALSIHVNWAWMPDVSSETLYNANMDSVKKDMSSPDPNYTDPIVFSKKKGYASEGNVFWYKEVDKKAGDEIHRWHIGAYGNKSNYGVILGGTYEQFKEWGPVFEEVVKSFKLIPIKQ